MRSTVDLDLREIILEEVPESIKSIYQAAVAVWFGFSGKVKDLIDATNAGHINVGD